MDLSIVIPVYNEAENVESLYLELREVLEEITKDYEIIYVDDGSNDGTAEKIVKINKENKNVHLVSFTRNFGLSAALAAGLKFVNGKVVVSIDGDLQHDPKDIPLLIEEINKGYDLVCGYRKSRWDDNLVRRLLSLSANNIARTIFKLNIHDFSSTLRVYKRSALDHIVIFNGAHRFIPVLAKRNKLLIKEVAISQRSRLGGVSKVRIIPRFFKIIKDVLFLKTIDLFLRFDLHLNFKEARFIIEYII